MQEWREGWHPEQINVKGASSNVLVARACPAVLEATKALVERGYEVVLAEVGSVLRGLVARERHLPGLSAW